MSNYWNLKCRTCGEVCELGWNHGGDEIQQLIPHLPALAAANDAIDIISARHYGDGFPSGLFPFAVRHRDHDLIAVDEYGVEHGICGGWYRCECCGGTPKCQRPNRHEGEHGPAIGDPS